MMNEVTATASGTIEEVFVANAEAVSTGTPLSLFRELAAVQASSRHPRG